MNTDTKQMLGDVGEALRHLADAVDLVAGKPVERPGAETKKPVGDYVMPEAVYESRDCPDSEGLWLGQKPDGEWDALDVIRSGQGEEGMLAMFVPGSARPAPAHMWKRFVGPLPDPRLNL